MSANECALAALCCVNSGSIERTGRACSDTLSASKRVGSRHMTEIELAEYANEHFLYELLMLRYSKHHLQVCRDRLRWNAMFAAFNVSARNFYDFLRED